MQHRIFSYTLYNYLISDILGICNASKAADSSNPGVRYEVVVRNQAPGVNNRENIDKKIERFPLQHVRIKISRVKEEW